MTTTLNFQNLARVRDRIAEVGDAHCNMDSFFDSDPRFRVPTISATGDVPCGTTACIAGWAVVLRYGELHAWGRRTAFDAAEWLGLPSGELFYMEYWPERFIEITEAEGDAKGMIAILDAVLDGTVIFDQRNCLVDLA